MSDNQDKKPKEKKRKKQPKVEHRAINPMTMVPEGCGITPMRPRAEKEQIIKNLYGF